MKRLVLSVIAVAAAVLLSGCYDLKETNDLIYAVAIGVDKGDRGNYDISIQYARVLEINAGTESGKSEADVLETVSVQAPTIYSAVSIVDNMMSKKLILSHVKIIVFSEEVAREGIMELVSSAAQNPNIRPHVYMAVSVCSAKEYLKSVKPNVEINPAKYYQLLYENKYASRIPKIMGEQIYYSMKTGDRDNVLPIANVTGGSEDTDAVFYQGGFEYMVENHIAGEGKGEHKNPGEVMGMALFSGDKMVGEAGGVEAELYNLLTGNFKKNYITLYNPQAGNAVTVLAEQKKKAKIIADCSSGTPQITVKLYLEAELRGDFTEQGLAEFETSAQEYISSAAEEFINSTVQDYGIDILGVSRVIKRKFLTYSDFEEYNWGEERKKMVFNVETEFKVKRTGLVVKSREEK